MDYNFKQICFNKRLNVKKKIKKVLFIFKQKSILVLYIYMKNKKMEIEKKNFHNCEIVGFVSYFPWRPSVLETCDSNAKMLISSGRQNIIKQKTWLHNPLIK